MEYTAAGCFQPALAAADADRFSRDHCRDRAAVMHAQGVHDPGHDAGVCANVGGGNIALRADDQADLGGITAGHALELAFRELFWIDDHATLGAAVGDADYSVLPGHQHCQRPDLVQSQVRAEANTALGWAAGVVVLHPIAGENAGRAIVHAHGEINRELAFGA